jgi:hypothetical protein
VCLSPQAENTIASTIPAAHFPMDAAGMGALLNISRL